MCALLDLIDLMRNQPGGRGICLDGFQEVAALGGGGFAASVVDGRRNPQRFFVTCQNGPEWTDE